MSCRARSASATTACSSTPRRRPPSRTARPEICATPARIPACKPSCAAGTGPRTRRAPMAEARPAVVGGFVLGGLCLVIAAVIFFGGARLFVRTDRAVVFFEHSVGGLVPGASVTFRGVRVGSVASVALVLDTDSLRAQIPVYLELVPAYVTFAGAPAAE